MSCLLIVVAVEGAKVLINLSLDAVLSQRIVTHVRSSHSSVTITQSSPLLTHSHSPLTQLLSPPTFICSKSSASRSFRSFRSFPDRWSSTPFTLVDHVRLTPSQPCNTIISLRPVPQSFTIGYVIHNKLTISSQSHHFSRIASLNKGHSLLVNRAHREWARRRRRSLFVELESRRFPVIDFSNFTAKIR